MKGATKQENSTRPLFWEPSCTSPTRPLGEPASPFPNFAPYSSSLTSPRNRSPLLDSALLFLPCSASQCVLLRPLWTPGTEAFAVAMDSYVAVPLPPFLALLFLHLPSLLTSSGFSFASFLLQSVRNASGGLSDCFLTTYVSLRVFQLQCSFFPRGHPTTPSVANSHVPFTGQCIMSPHANPSLTLQMF